ncbi:MAG: Crp/Fnr family transcriptional regulator [Magnetospirillum sp. WYHS-4]
MQAVRPNHQAEAGVLRSLRNVGLLEVVPRDILAEIERSARWIDLAANRIVIDRNEATTDVYFIVRGRVRIVDFLDGRQEVVLADLGSGDNFGELSAIDGNRRSARVMTSEPTLLAALSAAQFNELLLRCPEMATLLLRRFAGLVRAMNGKVTALSSLTAYQRIYMELLRLAQPNPQGDGTWVIRSCPNHQDLASIVGVEREEVGSAIGELARGEIVERKHKSLIIRDYPRLQLLASM